MVAVFWSPSKHRLCRLNWIARVNRRVITSGIERPPCNLASCCMDQPGGQNIGLMENIPRSIDVNVYAEVRQVQSPLLSGQ